MNMFAEVLRELVKMFVADLRLTLEILIGIAIVALASGTGWLGPVGAGVLLVLVCLAVLAGAVLREARARHKG